jgi:hypothetical protein
MFNFDPNDPRQMGLLMAAARMLEPGPAPVPIVKACEALSKPPSLPIRIWLPATTKVTPCRKHRAVVGCRSS